MGLLKTLTQSVAGAVFLIIVISLVTFTILYWWLGNNLIGLIGGVFISTIIPGIIMVFGLALIFFGFKGEKGTLVLTGFMVFAAGFILAAILGAF